MVDYWYVRIECSNENSHGLCICIRGKKLVYGADFSYYDQCINEYFPEQWITHESLDIQCMDGGHTAFSDIIHQKKRKSFAY